MFQFVYELYDDDMYFMPTILSAFHFQSTTNYLSLSILCLDV
jgi:hypothetical protein